MSRYLGKKAVVTGGTHGMGLGIARALVQNGAEVLITGRNEQALEAARKALGPKGHAVRSDAADLRDIDGLGAIVQEKLGAIDAVFVNAGYSSLTTIADATEADYDRTFAINAKGPFFTVKRLAPLVRDGGAFVFTTSIADELGYPGMSIYAGSKSALRSFAQGVAAEYLPRRIRANSLSPGFIKTPTMGVYGATEAQIAAFEKEGEVVTPMKRIGTIEEVAAAALFLAFDATFTTGIELVLDGGMTTLAFPNHST
jgi:NAD(P)-dependent dehydrogenase (short-subunit alcohol dehydrogenase family)